ncbi:hypothetical protein [Actinomadura sp. 3N508]|uniref:hypothetical protein n=1 Tax=Actinomadura sp. 3N508 TaxID=3375153 RepID=UPI00378A6352
MNSTTMTLTMMSFRSMLAGTYRRHRTDSSRPAELVLRNLLWQVEGREHLRIGEHDVVQGIHRASGGGVKVQLARSYSCPGISRT